MTQYLNDSIFWIEVEKITPNPYQPRRDFDQNALQDLADSIRQYGILQPLVVTRIESEKEDGGLRVAYELIAGERRLRASKIAGLNQIPAVIRAQDADPRTKLEIAIIENLQREDLNAVDRAYAFSRLAKEFGFKHGEIAKKVGRSREYVSNTLRLLDLPEEAMNALRSGKITEGHARTVMMLSGKPDEQKVLFKEILYKKLSVREAEKIAREVAHDRVRKKHHKPDPELTALEGKFSDTLGTRVHIERKENGGKVVIDFFSNDDLQDILKVMESNERRGASAFMDRFIATQEQEGQEEQAGQENTGNHRNDQDEEVLSSSYESSNENNPVSSAQDPYGEHQNQTAKNEAPRADFPYQSYSSSVSSVLNTDQWGQEKQIKKDEYSEIESGTGDAHGFNEEKTLLSPPDQHQFEKSKEDPQEKMAEEKPNDENVENLAFEEKEKEDEDIYSVKNFTI